jgi:hypothetical protein
VAIVTNETSDDNAWDQARFAIYSAHQLAARDSYKSAVIGIVVPFAGVGADIRIKIWI